VSQQRWPPGGQVSVAEAVRQAAAALTPPYEVVVEDAEGADSRWVELRDPGGRLPDLTLKLQREKRMFSRTFPLWVVSQIEAPGPSVPGVFEYLRPRLVRRPSLRWVGRPGADHRPWLERFDREGLVRGATTMTNVQHLAVLWNPDERTWILQLATLAGSLIGVGPANSYAVPLEPADIEGLLVVLRAFAEAVKDQDS
jgi:hypothetical protein